MNDPFLGEIMLFAGNFTPDGWVPCDGRLLPIESNDALFSFLGTIYGGDGQATFAVPDLRGRVPVGTGQGVGLPPIEVGQPGGEAAHMLSISELPTRDISITSGSGSPIVTSVVAADPAGTGQPHNNMQPFLGLNYFIATRGSIPRRSTPS